MGRRALNTHLWTGERANTRLDRTEPLALCGDDDHWNTRTTTDRDRVNCGKCAQALAEIDIEIYNRVNPGAKLELVRDKEDKSYRFVYRVLSGGEHVGYVIYDGAYANGAWYLTPIRLPDDHRKTISPGGQLDTDGTVSRWSDHGTPYNAKEEALLAAHGEMVKGELKSVVAMERDRKDRAAEWTRIEAKVAADDARKAEERTEALKSLQEVLDTISLTNFQRMGIHYAIKKLTPKKKDVEA